MASGQEIPGKEDKATQVFNSLEKNVDSSAEARTDSLSSTFQNCLHLSETDLQDQDRPQGADTTEVKEVIYSRNEEGIGDGASGVEPSEYLHHQCSHEDGVVDHEVTLHHPKQEVQRGLSTEEEYLRSTSKDTMDRPCSSSSSAVNTSLTSSLSSIAPCDKCTASFKQMICSNSIDFWCGIDGTRFKCCERIWSNFEDRLGSYYPLEPSLKQGRVLKLLKSLLGVNAKLDAVTIDKYLRLVRFFGPFRCDEGRCINLKNLEDLVSKSNKPDPKNKKKKISWFAGPMSREEALTKLKDKSPGTFLIRMSETEEDEGNFVLDLVMGDSNIEHFLIQGKPDTTLREDPFRMHLQFQDKIFESLPDLVAHLRTEEISDGCPDNAVTCRTVCSDLPYNSIMTGYK